MKLFFFTCLVVIFRMTPAFCDGLVVVPSHRPQDPAYLHLAADAPVQFRAILYIPKTPPEFFNWIKLEPGVDLYSRKVLVQKGSKEIVPDYLRFVRGVVDAADLNLNISQGIYIVRVRSTEEVTSEKVFVR